MIKYIALISGFLMSLISFKGHATTVDANSDQELRYKIGASIIIGMKGNTIGDPGVEEAIAALKRGDIGGLIFFRANIKDPQTFKELMEHIMEESTNGFYCVDQEGGLVRRFRPENGFEDNMPPSALETGQTSPQEAEEIFNKTAALLKEFHITCNLAPVLDIYDTEHPSNETARSRSYGNTPEKVTEYAGIFCKALLEHNVLPCGKHFPGHRPDQSQVGGGDTHHQTVNTQGTAKWDADLYPYITLGKNGLLPLVMISHVTNKDYDPKGWPASLSPKMVASLRIKGYTGATITDDLTMKAIIDHYDIPLILERATRACDLLLLKHSLENFREKGINPVDIIFQMVKDGKLSRELIEARYERIQKLKQITQR